jgi:hypothetical protein
MTTSHRPLEQLWHLLREGDPAPTAALLASAASWDDPLFGKVEGAAVLATAVPRLAAWLGEKSTGAVEPLRTTADDKRVVVESVLGLRGGLIWNQAEQKAQKADVIQLPVAVVADRVPRAPDTYAAVRVYFGTWAVLDGAPKVRVGPIAPDERAETAAKLSAVPVLRRYFDLLAAGGAEIVDLFEPDGYFREPANNFACGRDQLQAHFDHILALGGVGVEFLTLTREDVSLAMELQTITWGRKTMDQPQAGFASYEIGPHGKLRAGRVYDSVVPPL